MLLIECFNLLVIIEKIWHRESRYNTFISEKRKRGLRSTVKYRKKKEDRKIAAE
jgi:hypothetical protein